MGVNIWLPGLAWGVPGEAREAIWDTGASFLPCSIKWNPFLRNVGDGVVGDGVVGDGVGDVGDVGDGVVGDGVVGDGVGDVGDVGDGVVRDGVVGDGVGRRRCCGH